MGAVRLIRRQSGHTLLIRLHELDQGAAFFGILNILFGTDLVGVRRLEDSAASEGQILDLFISGSATGRE